ncbi:cytochrome b5-like heme/steroid binding domain-containing protein [Lipomyces arxii]|uniref:cytochrome b5-like heme/steroid binding domain-containing protein n=1 Tax=Lipomyces arxii TaxID=56418 RepID=UPI0034CD4C5E
MSARYRMPYSKSNVREREKVGDTSVVPIEQIKHEVEDGVLMTIARLLFIVISMNFLLSYYITSTFFWTYDSRLLRQRYLWFLILRFLKSTGINKLIRSPSVANFTYPQIFTESDLAQYDGLNPALPIYVALNGSVYDVTENKQTYGPAGPYHHFAGRDAARAFVTGCFTSDLTHDLRGLDPESAERDVQSWQNFFAHSSRYWYVGDVVHDPLTGPPPGPCKGPSRSR